MPLPDTGPTLPGANLELVAVERQHGRIADAA